FGLMGAHCQAPAGLFTSSHSYSNNILKYVSSHWVGVGVHAPSMPLPIVSLLLPLPYLLIQPRPWASMGASSGDGPTWLALPAPWAFPNVWPPAVRATVSSSFMPILAKVSLMSRALANGSGLPFGPSGFT